MAKQQASSPARTGAAESVADLVRLARSLPEAAPPWVRRLRQSGLERFRSLGWPSPKAEEWRQTDLSPITGSRFEPAPEVAPSAASELGGVPGGRFDCPRIVFVNGRHADSLSDLRGLARGVRVESLATALETHPETLELYLGRHAGFQDHPFAALNTANLADGAVVSLPANTVIDVPIHLLFVTSAGGSTPAIHPRVVVLAGENVQASVLETYASLEGSGPYLTNAVTELVLGENASVNHCRVQLESEHAFHVGVVQAHQARDSRYVNHNVSLGAALARHDVGSVLDGEGAEATLDGLYIATGSQTVDNHTVLDHAKPHCPSHELYKGILAGTAEAVFNGRIIVRPDAQKTDAKQSNQNLLLSSDALIHTRPQLEIYADDVKCTHGATIGQLEEEALFYVRSRGIPIGDARALLIHGFTRDVLERIPYASMRELLERRTMDLTSRELGRRMQP